MCDCDFYPPDIYEEIKRKARKQHKCVECRVPIKKGDDYYAVSGLWEGSWSNYKVCQECYDLGKYLSQVEDCFCWNFGELFENIRQGHYFEDYDKIISYNYEGENLLKVDDSVTEDSPDYDEDLHCLFYADVYRLIPF